MRAYNSSNFEDVLLSGDVWLAQGWNGQFARAMAQDSDIAYVVPREGSNLFLDSLAIPRMLPMRSSRTRSSTSSWRQPACSSGARARRCPARPTAAPRRPSSVPAGLS